MGTGQRRSALTYIPGYKNNAVLQLIIFSATAYITLAIAWSIIMIVFSGSDAVFHDYFVPNIALGHLTGFKDHFWTILTYGWFQEPNSFFELLSSMLWLYCFGSVVQMLVGHKQVIPLFVYSLLIGGLVYMLAQLLPGSAGLVGRPFMGSRAGLMGMAAAAVTLTPQYRLYLTPTFSVPLVLVAGIFGVLMLLSSGLNIPVLLLLISGGLTGYGYIMLLRKGYRPGEWIYNLAGKIESTVTPSEKVEWTRSRNTRTGNAYEPKHGISQSRIDEILDKINQKGYNSLSKEEKEALLRAGKD